MMKTVLSILFVLCILFFNNFTTIFPKFTVHAEQEVPTYAIWGKLAMEKTKEKYPNASIIDYLHIGREEGTNTTTEKFKLWLKQNNREFGVFVDITFDQTTEQVIDIKFRETAR